MRSILVISLVLCTHMLHAQPHGSIVKLYRLTVNTLAADDMEGRLPGTIGEQMARQWITGRYKVMSIRPELHTFSYRNCDTCPELRGDNIYHYVDNNADSTVLIGAHYDHLGTGGGRSRSYGKKGIHPGADDNASGVALMLGLAQRRAKWMQRSYNYIFVNYTAHEMGLFGSAAFYEYCKTHFKPICLAINFDMVGRMDEHHPVLTVYATKTSPMTKIAGFNGLIHTDEPEKVLQTDCRSFAEHNMACLSFTTGLHEDYHKIGDTPDKINYEGMWEIQKLIERMQER